MALAAFKENLMKKKKMDILNSTSFLNDFIAETNHEDEYSPEKVIKSPVKKSETPKRKQFSYNFSYREPLKACAYCLSREGIIRRSQEGRVG